MDIDEALLILEFKVVNDLFFVGVLKLIILLSNDKSTLFEDLSIDFLDEFSLRSIYLECLFYKYYDKLIFES